MKQRIQDLENHAEGQNQVIERLTEAVERRDDKIKELEETLDEMERERHTPVLVFDGTGVPPPPATRPWQEDISATVTGVVRKFMPDIEMSGQDIVHAYRTAKGKKIVCKFSRCGKGSTSDNIYEKRASLRTDESGQPRDKSDQLFINEMVSAKTNNVLKKLRDAKKAGVIHSVFTNYGHIYVRMIEHGQKIRVRDQRDLSDILLGNR